MNEEGHLLKFIIKMFTMLGMYEQPYHSYISMTKQHCCRPLGLNNHLVMNEPLIA